MIETFGNNLFKFLKDLKPEFKLPGKIELLLPFENREAVRVSKEFFKKYYNVKCLYVPINYIRDVCYDIPYYILYTILHPFCTALGCVEN